MMNHKECFQRYGARRSLKLRLTKRDAADQPRDAELT